MLIGYRVAVTNARLLLLVSSEVCAEIIPAQIAFSRVLTVQPAWQPVAVGGNQVVNKSIYFVNAQHGGSMRVQSSRRGKHGRDFRKNSFGQQRLYVDVGLHQGGQMRR